MPVRKCTDNSHYVKSRDHFWIPHQLFHGQSGRELAGKQGEFLFQVTAEALNAINLMEGYFHFSVFSAYPSFHQHERTQWR